MKHSRAHWRAVVEQSPKWQPIKSWRVWRDRWGIPRNRRIWLTVWKRPTLVLRRKARLAYELAFCTPDHVKVWGAKHTPAAIAERNARIDERRWAEAHLPICSGTVSYRWDNERQAYDEIDRREVVPCRY